MTKEEFIDLIESTTRFLSAMGSSDGKLHNNVVEQMNKFFSSNVCIPKGENRHPYADVYHEAVEGKEWQWSEDGVNWYDVVPPRYMYRIKPQEPMYEYLWLDLRTPDDFYCPTSKYMTENEACTYFNQSETYFKVLETKRVRQ